MHAARTKTKKVKVHGDLKDDSKTKPSSDQNANPPMQPRASRKVHGFEVFQRLQYPLIKEYTLILVGSQI